MNSFNSFLNKAKEEFKNLDLANTLNAGVETGSTDPLQMQLQLVEELKREQAKTKALRQEIEDIKARHAHSSADSAKAGLEDHAPNAALLNRAASPVLPTANTLAPPPTSTTPDRGHRELDASLLESENKSLGQTVSRLQTEINQKEDTIAMNQNVINGLNKQIDDLKGPKELKGPSPELVELKRRFAESEKKNLSLSEQNNDLKMQISSKKSEVSSMRDLVTCRETEISNMRTEYDVKLKRLDEEITVSKDELAESKKNASLLETELTLAKERLSEMSRGDARLQTELSERDTSIQSLQSEIVELKLSRANEGEDLQKQLLARENELEQVKAEFSSYKIRAHAALSKTQSSAFEDRVKQMEDLVNKLNLELKEKNSVLDESNSKASQLVKEITERDLEMETLQSRLDSVMIENAQVAIIKQENDEIRAKLDTERREFALKSDSLKREYTNKFEDAERTWQAEFDRMTASLKTSQEELLGLRTIAEKLGNDVTRYTRIIEQLREDLEDARNPSNITPTARRDSLSATSSGIPDTPTSRRESSSGGEGNVNTFKEKEYMMNIKQLSELLNEAESNVQLLTEQKEALAEELRKLDRAEKRQDLSIEYLKNIVLQFLEADPDQREPLLVVVAQILQLSPEETNKLRKSAIGDMSPSGMMEGWFY